jgi:hypothetical protein
MVLKSNGRDVEDQTDRYNHCLLLGAQALVASGLAEETIEGVVEEQYIRGGIVHRRTQ